MVSGLPAVLPSEVRVTLNMPHTYPADMVFNLRAPNGQILSLYKHNTNTDNGPAAIPTAGFFNAVVSSLSSVQFLSVPTPYRYGQTPPAGPYRADALNGVTNPGYTIMDPPGYVSNALTFNALAGPGGANLNGNWTLAMVDGGPGDLGTLTSWSLTITQGAPAAGVWTQTSPASPNSMFSDPAATTAYIAGTPANTIYVRPRDIAPFTGTSATYCVVYSTASPSCTSAPTCVTVNVTSPINGLAAVPGTNSVCLGSTATFTANTVSGGPLTYVWQVSINGGITYNNVPGGTSKILTIPNVTQLMNNYLYRVTVTAAPCGSLTSGTDTLKILSLPVVSISAPDLALTPGQTTTITASVAPPLTGVTYSWTRNGSVVAGATGSTIVVGINQLGTYRATVTASNGCTNTSNNLVIGSEQSDRLWIYPNPTTGAFEVRLFFGDNTTENRFVSVYNVQGQVVATKEVVLTNATEPYAKITFDLSGQAAGTYVVKVAHKRTGKVTSGLVVKQSQ